MRKVAIPATPPLDNTGLRITVENIRYNLEIITGRRGGQIKALSGGASTTDIVAKINELILLLQE